MTEHQNAQMLEDLIKQKHECSSAQTQEASRTLTYKWVKKKYIFIQSYNSLLNTYTHIWKNITRKAPWN